MESLRFVQPPQKIIHKIFALMQGIQAVQKLLNNEDILPISVLAVRKRKRKNKIPILRPAAGSLK